MDLSVSVDLPNSNLESDLESDLESELNCDHDVGNLAACLIQVSDGYKRYKCTKCNNIIKKNVHNGKKSIENDPGVASPLMNSFNPQNLSTNFNNNVTRCSHNLIICPLQISDGHKRYKCTKCDLTIKENVYDGNMIIENYSRALYSSNYKINCDHDLRLLLSELHTSDKIRRYICIKCESIVKDVVKKNEYNNVEIKSCNTGQYQSETSSSSRYPENSAQQCNHPVMELKKCVLQVKDYHIRHICSKCNTLIKINMCNGEIKIEDDNEIIAEYCKNECSVINTLN
jgi:hypothetical protein